MRQVACTVGLDGVQLRRKEADMEFNVNEKVRVILTDHGRAMHRADHEKFWLSVRLEVPPYTPPKEDADGWSEWQLCELMEAFGPHTHLGSKICFETTMNMMTSNDPNSGAARGPIAGGPRDYRRNRAIEGF